jgi:ABC-type cobalamin transport system ATPase subunit
VGPVAGQHVGLDERARVEEQLEALPGRQLAARVLLLDEPTANLDPAAAELLEPLIGRGSGRSRVLVSHDVGGALGEADEVLRLKRGRTVGEDEELYR